MGWDRRRLGLVFALAFAFSSPLAVWRGIEAAQAGALADAYHAKWELQSAYARSAPGGTSSFVIAFRNTGERGWLRGAAGQSANLGTADPLDTLKWSAWRTADWLGGDPNRVATQTTDWVGPGQIGWFATTFKVPVGAAAGTYQIALRPVIEGVTWLEDEGVFHQITVPFSAHRTSGPEGMTVSGDLLAGVSGEGLITVHVPGAAPIYKTFAASGPRYAVFLPWSGASVPSGTVAIPRRSDLRVTVTLEGLEAETDERGSSASPTPVPSPAAVQSTQSTSTLEDVTPTSSVSAPAHAGALFTVTVSYSDTGSGVARVELYAKGPDDTAFRKIAEREDLYSRGRGSTNFSVEAGQGEGIYEFYSIASDSAGNVEETPPGATGRALVDLTAPTSTTLSATPSSTLRGAWSIRASASDGKELSQVRLYAKGPTESAYSEIDRVPGAGTEMSVLFSDFLPTEQGDYLFYTRALDAFGNWEPEKTNAEVTIRYDTVPPTGSVASPLAANAQFNVTVSYSDGLAGLGTVELYVRVPGSAEAVLTDVRQISPAATSGTAIFTYSPLNGVGQYEFSAVLKDAAQNVTTVGATTQSRTEVDVTAPVSSLTGAPASPANGTAWTLQASATDNYALASVTLYQRRPGDAVYTPVETVIASGTSASLTFAPFVPTLEGTYEFYTRATDAAGTVEVAPGAPDRAVLADLTAPASSITAAPSSPRNTGAWIIEASGSDGVGLAAVALYVQRPGESAYTLVQSSPVSGTSANVTFNAFTPGAEGAYAFHTRGTDTAGNVEAAPGAADRVIVYDTTAPVATATAATPTPTNTPSWSLGASVSDAVDIAAVSLYVRTPGSGSFVFVSTVAASGTSANVTFPPYAPGATGAYDFIAAATDAAGNSETVGAATETTVVYDLAPPASTAAGGPGSPTNSAAWTFTANPTDAVALGSVALYVRVPGAGSYALHDTQSVSGTSANVTFAPFIPTSGNGVYDFYTRATDAAGNLEAAPGAPDTSVDYDGTRPASSAATLQGTPTRATPWTLTASATDNAALAAVALYVRIPGSPSFTLFDTQVAGGVADTVTFLDFTPSADGVYDFYTVATDAVGNVETSPGSPDVALTYDTTAPASAVSLAPGSPTASTTWNLEASVSDGAALASVELWVREPGAGSAALVESIPTTGTSAVVAFSPYTPSAGDGTYEIYSIARDVATNAETAPGAPDRSVVLDTTAPASSATSSQSSPTNTTTWNIGANASDAVGLTFVSLYVRTPGAGTYALVETVAVSGTSATPSFTPYTAVAGPGDYAFYTRSTDQAANSEAAPGAADLVITYDTGQPSSSLTGGPASPTNTSPWNFGASATDSVGLATVELWVRTPGAGSFTLADTQTVSGTSATPSFAAYTPAAGDGTYEFYTRAYDDAGNSEDAPGAPDAAIVRDATAPVAGATSVARTNQATVTVSANYSDATSGVVRIALYVRTPGAGAFAFAADQTFAAEASGSRNFVYTFGAGEGAYDFYAVARDAALNDQATPAGAQTTTVSDTTGPTSTAATAQGSPTNTSVWTITGNAVDAGGALTSVALYVRTPGGAYTLFDTKTASGGADTVTFEVYTAAAGDGDYDFYTRALDAAGNLEAAPGAADLTITRDATVPASSMTGGPSSPTPSSPWTFGATATDNRALADVSLYVRRPGDVAFSLVETVAAAGTSDTVSFSAYTPAVGDGLYDFYTIARDAVGNVEATPGVPDRAIVLDTIAPVSSVTGGPTDPTNTTTWTISASATDGNALASVALYARVPGAGAYALVQSKPAAGTSATVTFDPYTPAAGDGTYQLYTRATDAAGNVEADPGAADRSAVLDTTAPSATASGLALTNASPLVITANYSDALSGVTAVALYVRTPGAGAYTLAETQTFAASGAGSRTFNYAFAAGDGAYAFYATATDAAGNADSVPGAPELTSTYDTTAPASSLTGGPASPTNSGSWSFGATASDAVGLASVSLYHKVPGSGTFTLVETVAAAGTSATPSFSAYVPGAGEGSYEFYTRAADTIGNAEAAPGAADRVIVYSTTAPGSSVTVSPSSPTNTGAWSIQASASGPVSLTSVKLYVKAPGAGSYTLHDTKAASGTSASVTFASYSATLEGTYEMYTLADDAAGNTEAIPGAPDVSIVRDVTAPASSASSPAFTSASPFTVTVSYSDDRAGVTAVTLYARAPGAGSYSAVGTQTFAASLGGSRNFSYAPGAGDGDYDFYALATDAAGNAESAPGLPDATSQYDTTLPSSVTTGGPATPTTNGSWTFGATATDNLGLGAVALYVRTPGAGSYSLVESVPTSGTSASVTFSAYVPVSGDGAYDFYTRATDNTGNAEAAPGAADRSVYYDTTAPASNATSAQATPTNSGTWTIGASASDAGGLASVSLYVQVPGAGSYALVETVTVSGTTASPTFAAYTAAAGPGTYRFYTRALDLAGSTEAAPGSADVTIVLDTSAPSSNVNGGPTGPTAGSSWVFTAAAADDVALAAVSLYVRTPGAGSYTLVETMTASGTTDNVTFSAYTASAGEGAYLFYTRATDAATNVESAPGAADRTVDHDATAPTSSASSVTATNSSPISVTGTYADSGTGAVGVVQVQLWVKTPGAGSFALATTNSFAASLSGTTGFDYTPLAGSGVYEFYTRATDAAGNAEAAPAGADDSTNYDTTVPSAAASAPDFANTATVGVTATYSDPGGAGAAGVTQVDLYVRVPGAGAFALALTNTFAPSASGSTNFTYTFSGGDGTYDFYARARDDAGNQQAAPGAAQDSTVYDTVAPTSSAASAFATNSGSVTVTGTYSDATAGVTAVSLYVRTPGAGSYALAETQTFAASASGTRTFTYPFGAGEGAYAFYIRATDAAGNVEAAPAGADSTTNYDLTAPASSLSSGPLTPTGGTSWTFGASASDGIGLASAALYVKTPGAGSFSLVESVAASGTSASVSFSAYTPSAGDGTYEFYSRATDAAGNVEAAPGAADRAVVLDTAVPASSASAAAATNASPIIVTGTYSDTGSGVVQVDLYVRTPGAGSYALALSNTFGASGSGTTIFSYTPAAGQGAYAFYTRATDAAGNVEAAPGAADVTTTYDTTAPVSTATGGPGGHTNTTSWTFTSSPTDNFGLATISLYVRTPSSGVYTLVETVSISGTSAGVTFAAYNASESEGTYRFYTRATDESGNAETAPGTGDLTVVLDQTPPNSSLSSGPTTPTNSNSWTFQATSADDVMLGAVSLYVRTPGAGAYSWVTTVAATGAFATSTFPAYVPSAGEGTYQFYSRAADAAGNSESAPGAADRAVIYDITAPVSVLTGGPASPTNTTSWSFGASVTDGVQNGSVALYVRTPGAGSYTLVESVAAAGTSATPSFTAYVPSAGDGTYDFYTRATDAAGNTETAPGAPDASFVLDTAAPGSSTSSPSATNASPFTVTASYTDTLSGVDTVELWVKRPGDVSFSLAATNTFAPSGSGTTNFSYTPAAGEGNYEFYSIAKDDALNSETVPGAPDSVTLRDVSAPSSSTASAANTNAANVTVTASYSDAGAPAAGVVQVDLYVKTPGAGSFSLTDSQSFAASGSGSRNFTYTFAAGQGSYEFYSRALDAAGNGEAAPAGADSVTVYDITVPASVTTGGPGPASNTTSWTFGASATDNIDLASVALYVKAPSGSYVLHDTKTVDGTSDTATFAAYTVGANGTYEIYTRATDQTGNVEPAPASPDTTVIFDDVAPASSAASPSYANAAFVVTGTYSDATAGVTAVSLYVRTPGAGSYALAETQTFAASPSGTRTFTYTPVAGEGTYDFYTLATDWAGNVEAAPGAADDSTVYDTTAPASAALTGPATPTNNASWVFTATPTDNYALASVTLYVKTPGAGSFTSVETLAASGTSDNLTFAAYVPSTNGTYEFYTRAADQAGNTEAAPGAPDKTVVYDNAAPSSSTSGPAYINGAWTVTATYSDATSGVTSIALYHRRPGDAGYSLAATNNFAASTSGTSNFSYTPDAGQGDYLFYSVASDAASNTEAVPGTPPDHTTVYDTTAPASIPTGGPATPTNTTTWNFGASATDDRNLASVALYVKTPGAGSFTLVESVAASGTSATPSFSAYTPAAGDGTYEFYTRATDAAGTAEAAPGTADATIMLDVAAPTSVTSAAAQYTNVSPYTIAATYSDATSGVTSVDLYVRTPGSGTYTLAATNTFAASTSGTSNFSYTFAAGEGLYRFYSRATDAAANTEAAPGTPPDNGVTYDTGAPTSSATGGPSTPTNTTSWTFTSSPADTYQLASVSLYAKAPGEGSFTLIETKAATGTSDAITFTAYTPAAGDGTYEFYTRAADQAGNTEAAPGSADLTVVLDRVNPSSTTSAAATHTATSPYTITATYSDDRSGVTGIDLYVKVPGAGSFALALTNSFAASLSGTSNFSYTFADGQGVYEFYSRAADAAANTEAAPGAADNTVTYDTGAPSSNVTGGPATPTNTAAWTFGASATDTYALASVSLYVRTPGAGSYALVETVAASGTSATPTFSVYTATTNGTYDFYTRATDAAGNVEAAPGAPDVSKVYDNVAPASVTSAAAQYANASPYTITATYSDATSGVDTVELYVKRPGDAGFALTATNTFAPSTAGTSNFSYSFAAGQGLYEFYSRAYDDATNGEAAPGTPPDNTVTYDTGDPSSSAVSSQASPTTTSTWTFTSAPTDTYQLASVSLYVRTPGAGSYALVETKAATGTSDAITFANYTAASGDGTYDFYTRATDAAGNTEAAPGVPDKSIVRDTTAPASSTSAAAQTNSTPFTVTATYSDATSGVTSVALYVRRPGDGAYSLVTTNNFGASTSGTSNFSYTPNAGTGNYLFYSIATDAVGNVESAPASPPDNTTLYDADFPTSSASASSPTTSTPWNVTGTYSDTGSGVTSLSLYVMGPGQGSYSLYETQNFTASTSGNRTFSYSACCSFGTYYFYTRATDATGNVEAAPGSYDVSVQYNDPYSPTYYGPSYYGPSYYGPSYYGPSYYGPSYYEPSYYEPGYYGPSYYGPGYYGPGYYGPGYYSPFYFVYGPAYYPAPGYLANLPEGTRQGYTAPSYTFTWPAGPPADAR